MKVLKIVFLLLFASIPLGCEPSGKATGYSFLEGNDACIVEFEDLSINLENSFASANSRIPQGRCKALFEQNEENIMFATCSNSETLGEVVLKWNDETLLARGIECPESLSEEDVGVSVEGEFMILIVHTPFESGEMQSYEIYQIESHRTGEVYDLKVSGSPDFEFTDFTPGDIIKVRGKITNRTLTLPIQAIQNMERAIELVERGNKHEFNN